MSNAPVWALWLYRCAMRALPRAFRQRYDSELEAVFRERWRHRSGSVRRTALLRRELVDVMTTALRMKWQARVLTRQERRANRGSMLEWLRDARQAVRVLQRQRGYVAAVCLTLAIGIGSATAAFHIGDALLLQPLPHENSSELVMVWQHVPAAGMTRAPMSYPTFEDLRRAETGLADLAVVTGGSSAIINAGSEPERADGVRVSGNLFRLLGNNALLGRTLQEGDAAADAEPVLVLSHGLWQRQFGGDATVLDRLLTIGDVPHRIVGVMAPEFVFPSARAQHWAPLRVTNAPRDLNFLTVIGRLAPDVSIEEAELRLSTVYRRLVALYPADYQSDVVTLEPRLDYLIGDATRIVKLVGLAAALLLLLALANVANLMLARTATRSRELAVRAALGAGRRRLLRDLLTESSILALVGIAAGVVLAHTLVHAVTLLGADVLPRRSEMGLDARALVFAAAAGMLSALICSVVPVWRAALSARAVLPHSGTRSTVDVREGRLQGGFVIAQVALAFALLLGAGLLAHSLIRLLAVPVGFDGSRVLTAHLSLPRTQYDSPARIDIFYDGLLAAVRGDSRVEHAGAIWALPFSHDYASSSYLPDDTRGAPSEPVNISETGVRGDYFAAVGMTLSSGRLFTATDTRDAPAVVIVNETLARRFWPGSDAVGRTLRDPKSGEVEATVVGVVSDVRRRELAADVEPEVYLPHAQALWDGALYVVVRTRGEPLRFADAFRRYVWAIDANLPVAQVSTLEQLVQSSVAAPRFRTFVVTAVSAAAALLAMLGLYALLAYAVATRTRDIAIRMALGARRRTVIGATLWRGLRLCSAGILLGAALALPIIRVVRAVSFRVPAVDVPVAVAAVTGFLLMSLCAAYVPASRASRVEPLEALRAD